MNVTFKRHRRLRKTAAIRAMVKETTLSANDFIYPLFVTEETNKKTEVPSMPGVFQFSLDRLNDEVAEVQN